jgi:hypothetical protein
MNPYDFVRIDPRQHVHREQPRDHAHFSGLTGRLEGTITTLTPLFIPDRRGMTPKRFQTNAAGLHIIPGSSLKGMTRTLVETIGPGCWWLVSRDVRNKLPQEHLSCSQRDRLCVACRMFGLISGGTLLEGHVRFDDAICSQPVRCDPMFTPILDGPKPRHAVWYFAGSNGQGTGHKYYFHNQTVRTSPSIRKSNKGVDLNQHIAPIGINSTFNFSASFESLDAYEWNSLLYALALEPTMRHKIGYAKPAGLGSVEIVLTRIETIDMQRRYTSPDGGKTVYEGDALQTYVSTQTQRFTTDRTSVTLNDLRRIWQWPPPQGVEYGYPTREWFDQNPQAPISATLNAPRQ